MKTHYINYLLKPIIVSLDDCSIAIELTKNINAKNYKICSVISMENIVYNFVKTRLVILSSEIEHNYLNSRNKWSVKFNDLNCVAIHEKIQSADYLSILS